MKRLTMKSLYRYSLLTVPLMALLVLLSGCSSQGDEVAAALPPPEVDVAVVIEEPVTLWRRFTGRTVAPQTVDLRPRVSGYIDEVAFAEGELVQAGDLLFQIDPRPYKARKQAARAELTLAKSQLDLASSEATRAETLLQSRAISQEEYDQRSAALMSAQARVESAQAALQTAELDLQYTRVTSPISGRAGRALVTQGNLASADQTLLTTVVSVNPIYVYFEADERSALTSQKLLADGGPRIVHIALGSDEAHSLQGKVDFVDNHLNTGTGTLQYRAVLENREDLIKPGQFARVEMPVAELDLALLVHRKAVLADQNRRYVYVVEDDNRVAARQVTTGHQVDELLVIQEGLKSGDRVIINGMQKVFGTGMEVSPHAVAMRETASEDIASAQERAQ